MACVQSQLVPAHLTTGETLVQASGWAFCLKRHRPPSSDLTTTHEHIADTLGVRRESVTEAADNLQHLGLVRNSRGHVTSRSSTGLVASRAVASATVWSGGNTTVCCGSSGPMKSQVPDYASSRRRGRLTLQAT